MSREKVAELRIWRAEMVDTTGALILQIPANLSDEDRDHAVEVLELVIRQLRREAGVGNAPGE